MIKKFSLLFIAVLLALPMALVAQNKTFTIDEAVIGVWRELYPEDLYGLGIRPETKTWTKWDGYNFVETSFDLKKSNELFSYNDVADALKAMSITNRLNVYNYTWKSKNEIEFASGDLVFVFDVKSKKITKADFVESGHENTKYCAANSSFAYTDGNNLFVKANGETLNISNDSNTEIVYGQTVHRNEFGIDGGIFWSPKGSYLAFYRKDNSKVSDYPIVDVNERVAKLTPEKYCMAGMDSEEVTIGVYNMASKKTTYLNTGAPKDQYLTSVTWSPDEKSIYVGILNRGQNHLKFCRFNAENGELEKVLFEEKNDRYVEPQHPITFLPNDASKFIYWSRKDGFWHLYLYGTDGTQISQITKGNFEVQEIYGFVNNYNELIINANKETPIDFTVYKVNIQTGQMTLLGAKEGSHSVVLSNDGEYLIDSYSSSKVPRVVALYQTSTGKNINTLHTASDPLANYKLPEMRIGTLKADDGKTDLYYRMFLPPDFDPNKKYPAIVYVYGG
ncbi:MAG: DPP IV N-terminal domain-containing protein, partial [Bacteroidales bacterium]|nr:DPP IV N-terminal domain-containing protein [Bacteroidales bacterium]